MGFGLSVSPEEYEAHLASLVALKAEAAIIPTEFIGSPNVRDQSILQNCSGSLTQAISPVSVYLNEDNRDGYVYSQTQSWGNMPSPPHLSPQHWNQWMQSPYPVGHSNGWINGVHNYSPQIYHPNVGREYAHHPLYLHGASPFARQLQYC